MYGIGCFNDYSEHDYFGRMYTNLEVTQMIGNQTYTFGNSGNEILITNE